MDSKVKSSVLAATSPASEPSTRFLRRGSNVIGIYANVHSPHSRSGGPAYSIRQSISARALNANRVPHKGRLPLEPMLVKFFLEGDNIGEVFSLAPLHPRLYTKRTENGF